MLIWVEQKELRGLASDDRLFGRIAEPGWVLMDFNNKFKCRMGREDLSHVQFNPKLWNLRPVVKDSGEAMRVSLGPEAYAHVKENQQAFQTTGIRQGGVWACDVICVPRRASEGIQELGVAFRVQAAAGPMPLMPADKEDVVGSHISCHCPSHWSGS